MNDDSISGAEHQAVGEVSGRAVRAGGLRGATLLARIARHARTLMLAAIGALGVWHLRFHAPYTLDDAYITFRYSRNLARGLGLVFNPGEYVKGYSNTLYTVLMAVPELLGHDPIGTSKALGYASFIAIAWLGARAYQGDERPAVRDRALWFLLLAASSSSLAVHCVNGLETGLYTALLLGAVLRRVREQVGPIPPWSALLFCAVVLERPEGIAMFGAIALHDLWVRAWSRRFRLTDLVFYLAPPLCYATELLLSALYYGDPLPNTYYAKTTPIHGIEGALPMLWQGLLRQGNPHSYLSTGMQQTGLGLLGLLAISPALVERRHLRRNFALLLVVVAQLVFIVRARDDWAPGFRFGVPMLPPLFMLLAESIGTVARLARSWQRPCAALLMAALCWAVLPGQRAESIKIGKQRYVNADDKLREGNVLATLAEPGITLASFDIGGHGYAAGGFDVLDTAGLISRDTVGCYHRKKHCKRYAALVSPELVRLHKYPQRDGWIRDALHRGSRYLELNTGIYRKYLLSRALVLRPGPLPPWAAPLPAAVVGGATLLGRDAPHALAVRARSSATLFLRREAGAELDPALRNRRLQWRGQPGVYNARASDSLWKHRADMRPWRDGELFSDLVQLQAPPREGRYALELVAAGKQLEIAQVDVLADADALAARARRQVVEAEAMSGPQRSLERLRLLERAVRLSAAEALPAYHRAVVAHAEQLHKLAAFAAASRTTTALRLAQEAKRWLHRAAWEGRGASPSLRHAIDENGILRKRLLDALLSGN